MNRQGLLDELTRVTGAKRPGPYNFDNLALGPKLSDNLALFLFTDYIELY